ncbi:MAG TPA: DinB family protein [Candidatus Dormibacteraeota bacterium]|nr:DinB family protein [Candidatus Dormibacteraeota bacterium]
MKIENSFTMDDVKSFMDTYVDRERHMLADRLQRISERVSELGARVKDEPGDGNQWNAKEILAHIAVVSKFYGVLVHRVASGKVADFGLLDQVNLRDVAGKQMSELPAEQLVRTAREDQARTVEALRTAEPSALRQTVKIDDGSVMSAEDIARLPLVSHLELHLEQLEKALA